MTHQLNADKPALLQPPGKKAGAQTIMPDDLQNIRSAAPEDEEMP